MGGDVAFVKHTTARESTDGRNTAYWARNRRSDDYELLCNDGTRRDIDSWAECNMGEVPSNAVVTAGKLTINLPHVTIDRMKKKPDMFRLKILCFPVAMCYNLHLL